MRKGGDKVKKTESREEREQKSTKNKKGSRWVGKETGNQRKHDGETRGVKKKGLLTHGG